MKKILSYLVVSLLLLSVAGLAVWAYISVKRADSGIVCRKVDIRVKGSSDRLFVSCEDVAASLRSRFGGFEGRRLGDIDLEEVEAFVDGQSSVLKSEVYATPDSCLNIDIVQRNPVLRLLKDGSGCYCDCNGRLFPLQGKTSARVLTVDGDIPLDLSRSGRPEPERRAKWLDKMVKFAEYAGSRKWDGRISSVRADSRGELTIYMTDSPEAFLFGTPDDIESKFARIEKWYTALKPAVADRHYRTVNVKFDDQIVCRK